MVGYVGSRKLSGGEASPAMQEAWLTSAVLWATYISVPPQCAGQSLASLCSQEWWELSDFPVCIQEPSVHLETSDSLLTPRSP